MILAVVRRNYKNTVIIESMTLFAPATSDDASRKGIVALEAKAVLIFNFCSTQVAAEGRFGG